MWPRTASGAGARVVGALGTAAGRDRSRGADARRGGFGWRAGRRGDGSNRAPGPVAAGRRGLGGGTAGGGRVAARAAVSPGPRTHARWRRGRARPRAPVGLKSLDSQSGASAADAMRRHILDGCREAADSLRAAQLQPVKPFEPDGCSRPSSPCALKQFDPGAVEQRSKPTMRHSKLPATARTWPVRTITTVAFVSCSLGLHVACDAPCDPFRAPGDRCRDPCADGSISGACGSNVAARATDAEADRADAPRALDASTGDTNLDGRVTSRRRTAARHRHRR